MPSFLSRLWGAGASTRAPASGEFKASRTGPLLALQTLGLARWMPRNTAELTRAGYERNAVVYRCVRMIAETAATVPWLLYDNGAENEDHSLLQPLRRPNPAASQAEFLEQVFTNLMLSGNAYVEAVSLDGAPRELYSLRPDRMRIVPGANGWPEAFEYAVGAQKVRFAVGEDGLPSILHLKLCHPLDDHYGYAPLSAAQEALDVHNAAGGWNRALLENAARPSGALVYNSNDSIGLTQEQFDRLKSELDENFSGSQNAGRPLLLEDGLDWKALSLSPKDMDFIQAKAAAAREIALAFGVPPLLLGLPGDNTFANYSEANRAFWRQTIIPLVRRTQQGFAGWMAAIHGDIRIEANLDRIDALADEREAEWRRIGAAAFLSDAEKREALGYVGAQKHNARKYSDADLELRYSPDQPRVAAGNSDGGQWTDGEGGLGSIAAGLQDDLLPGTGEGLVGGLIRLAGGFAKDQLKMSVQAFASGHCQGRVFRRLPSQFLGMLISQVMSLAKGGNAAARSCIKILGQDRFRK